MVPVVVFRELLFFSSPGLLSVLEAETDCKSIVLVKCVKKFIVSKLRNVAGVFQWT